MPPQYKKYSFRTTLESKKGVFTLIFDLFYIAFTDFQCFNYKKIKLRVFFELM